MIKFKPVLDNYDIYDESDVQNLRPIPYNNLFDTACLLVLTKRLLLQTGATPNIKKINNQEKINNVSA